MSEWDFHTNQNAWSPPSDVFETAKEIVVKVEIAGMESADFNIDYAANVLTIQGHRPDIAEKRAFHRMELRYGVFKVKFEINIPVDSSSIAAEYRNGFLMVRLPKAETKKVQINPES